MCAPVSGCSSCVPLTVGGEVIGSVLLSRPVPYSEAGEQRIPTLQDQAAAGLANLRCLRLAQTSGDPARPCNGFDGLAISRAGGRPEPRRLADGPDRPQVGKVGWPSVVRR